MAYVIRNTPYTKGFVQAVPKGLGILLPRRAPAEVPPMPSQFTVPAHLGAMDECGPMLAEYCSDLAPAPAASVAPSPSLPSGPVTPVAPIMAYSGANVAPPVTPPGVNDPQVPQINAPGTLINSPTGAPGAQPTTYINVGTGATAAPSMVDDVTNWLQNDSVIGGVKNFWLVLGGGVLLAFASGGGRFRR